MISLQPNFWPLTTSPKQQPFLFSADLERRTLEEIVLKIDQVIGNCLWDWIIDLERERERERERSRCKTFSMELPSKRKMRRAYQLRQFCWLNETHILSFYNLTFQQLLFCSTYCHQLYAKIGALCRESKQFPIAPMNSVTRVGDFLHFGQLFKAFCSN